MRVSVGSSSSTPGVLGRFGRTVFFAIFLGMGLLFFGLLGAAMIDGARPLLWKTAPATILSSEVKASGDSYRAEIRYEYRWEGRAHASDVVSRPAESHERYGAAQEIVDAYPAGTKTTCRVNPERPAEAVLRVGNPWFALFLLLPLVFVGIGAAGILAAWRGDRTASAPRSSIRAGLQARAGRVVFGGIFVLVGVALTLGFSVPMWKRAFGSAKWTPTPCVVVSSKVGSHSDSDGTTYSVDILYRYTVAGREYRSDRYDAVGGSSSGHSGKAAIVARYPAGAKATCYVNPANPSEALLKPGAGWSVLFGLIPVVFLVVGGLVMLGGGTKNVAAAQPAGSLADAGEVELRATASPGKRVLLVLFIAVFWNGIVSVFASEIVEGFRNGQPDWMLTLFLTPFVGIGLVLVGAAVSAVLALANPRVRLWLDPAALRPGGVAKVRWELAGAVHRVRKLWIYLEGREEATYRRGSSTSTAKETFARLPIAEIESSWMEMARGEGTVAVPVGVPASFAASNNKIVWTIKVRGEIARFPDVAEEYEIPMNPQEELLWTLPTSS
jgi:hypothetical protein